MTPCLLFLASPLLFAQADELDEARSLYRSGRYQECLSTVTQQLESGEDGEDWHVLRLRALRATGSCAAAVAAVERALEDCRRDVRFRVEAYHLLRECGEAARARDVLDSARTMGRRYGYRYEDSAADQVALGRVDLLIGRDAKEVLDAYFTPAKALDPGAVAPHRATAELALQKHDYGLAAEAARAAIALDGEDPDLHVLLARSLATVDAAGTGAALARALELDPHHAEALLMSADASISAERYEQAEELVARVLAADSGHPRAWAWRAVLAHLQGDFDLEAACRDTALERWAGNPDVDHTIGTELSERYRFAEGAAAQRRALERDGDHLEARFQLAQDLLRLGRTDEGWELAEDVADGDPYHVVAYNLMLLRDVLAGYTTLERDGLVVRMEAREAEVYGERVLELLAEARDELAARYEVSFDGPITLELFEEQKDFAVRTFGLPGGDGFLGVCFGDVITMKSPVSQGEDPSNWEAVLWHELCHAVTLKKTRNRMPRWLSEGISVWEEGRRDPSWGQGMQPAYCARILAGEAWSIGELGVAFRQPDGPLGLQFAYFESALAVEYFVAEHGFQALLGVLDDLATGRSAEQSLAQHSGLGAGFDAWLVDRAQAWTKDLTWEPVELVPGDVGGLAAFADAHPQNVAALNRCAEALIGAGRAEEARPLLERSLELLPGLLGTGCAHELSARLEREAGAVEAELAVLDRWLDLEGDALQARLRRMELRTERKEWDAALAAARDVLAVQPMLASAHRARARAAKELGLHSDVLAAGRALLALGPVDPARVHFLMAEASHALGDEAAARRQVLMALEEGPRFREAHALLLELNGEGE